MKPSLQTGTLQNHNLNFPPSWEQRINRDTHWNVSHSVGMQQEHSAYPHCCFLLSYTLISADLFYVTIIARNGLSMCYCTKVFEGKRARMVDLFSQKHINFQITTFSAILRGVTYRKRRQFCAGSTPKFCALTNLSSHIPNE